VKRFIKGANPTFKQHKDTEVNFIPGKSPVLKLLDVEDKVVEEVDVANMKHDEISNLLASKGFPKEEL